MTNLYTINNLLSIQISGHEKLIVDYPVDHQDAIFDICDLDGRICISGRLNEGSNNEIDISTLNKGKYQIYIIDEGDIHREIIQLN